MYNKYDKFIDIKLEDTGIMMNSNKDTIYNRLSKNNITNLKELFELDDLNMIDYKQDNSLVRGYLSAKGAVKLLRTKYLEEEFPYIEFLESNLLDIREKKISFLNTMLLMGFTIGFANVAIDHINNDKVINLLEKIYEGKIRIICYKPEFERNRRKIAIILEWYHKKKLDVKINQINELRELRELVLNLKGKDEKKSEYMLYRIELDRLIESHNSKVK